MNGFSFKIATTPPFSFHKCLIYMQRSPLEISYKIQDNKITRLLSFSHDELPYLIEISSENDQHIIVTVLNHSTINLLQEQEIRQYIVEWFDLDRDLQSFARLVKQDAFLRETIEPLLGLRLIGVPDLFEALCWAIAGQQVNLPFAYRLKAQLVKQFGEKLIWNDDTYYLFPTAASLVDVTVEQLQLLQFTRAKAQTILRVAAQINEGSLSRQQLLDLPDYSLAEQRLVQIKGIGPWTANYVRMRCLRDENAYLPTDVGLQKVLAHWLQLPQKPTVMEIEHLFANWRNHSAYITFYLWSTLYH
ncbi:DNA-3-methyladenine glycosylase family protein [Paenibacillus yanchengensis]|uniref:DNA-3-methyladenine glycosylase II n=1 Tax=Paenibacillus yanchengensis TaxID=2035833 RepID=A0ABW4YMV5_9BACL